MTYILGHRGASAYAPENTLESFKMALDMQADGIELDVQLTSDGEIVVIHDEKVDRTSDKQGWVKDFTFEEIRKINVNNHKENYEFCFIPTLKEVFDLFKGTGKLINIEFKTSIIEYPSIVEKVLNLVKEYQMENQIIYSSFNHYTLLDVLAINPDAYCGFLHTDKIIKIDEYATKYKMKALHPAMFFLLDEKYVKKAFASHLDLNVWTINEPAYITAALNLNINSIITNVPDVALKIRDNLVK